MQQMFVNYDTIQKPMTFFVVVNEYFLKNPIPPRCTIYEDFKD